MNRTEDIATFDLPFAGVRSGQAHSVGSSPQPVQASANAASTCSRVWPVRVWMRPTSSCSLPSTNRRSSSVSFAHFCLSFPLTIFQLPLISNVFISSILLLGLARPWRFCQWRGARSSLQALCHARGRGAEARLASVWEKSGTAPADTGLHYAGREPERLQTAHGADPGPSWREVPAQPETAAGRSFLWTGPSRERRLSRFP